GGRAPRRGENRVVLMQETPLLEEDREIQLVDRAGGTDQIAEMFGDALAIAGKEPRRLGLFPATVRRDPQRRSEMMKGDDRRDPVLMARREHPPIMIEVGERKLAFVGLDPRPLDR